MEKDRIKKGIANSRRLLNLLHSILLQKPGECGVKMRGSLNHSLTVHWLVKMCSTWGGPRKTGSAKSTWYG